MHAFFALPFGNCCIRPVFFGALVLFSVLIYFLLFSFLKNVCMLEIEDIIPFMVAILACVIFEALTHACLPLFFFQIV